MSWHDTATKLKTTGLSVISDKDKALMSGMWH